jgi:hypothetical protein
VARGLVQRWGNLGHIGFLGGEASRPPVAGGEIAFGTAFGACRVSRWGPAFLFEYPGLAVLAERRPGVDEATIRKSVASTGPGPWAEPLRHFLQPRATARSPPLKEVESGGHEESQRGIPNVRWRGHRPPGLRGLSRRPQTADPAAAVSSAVRGQPRIGRALLGGGRIHQPQAGRAGLGEIRGRKPCPGSAVGIPRAQRVFSPELVADASVLS